MQTDDYDSAPLRFTKYYKPDEEIVFDSTQLQNVDTDDFLVKRFYSDPISWFEPYGDATAEEYFEETVVLYMAYRLGGKAREAINCYLGLILLIVCLLLRISYL